MRKLLGVICGALSLGSAMFFTAFAVDLVTGGDPTTGTGVLAGLVVFFGGLAATSGYGAWRMFARKRAEISAAAPAQAQAGIDIALEARILAHAAASKGRVTVAEIALACGVTLERAEQALDLLAQRGHANLQITESGDRVYVVAGFLTDAEKEQAKEILEVARER